MVLVPPPEIHYLSVILLKTRVHLTETIRSEILTIGGNSDR